MGGRTNSSEALLHGYWDDQQDASRSAVGLSLHDVLSAVT